MLCAHGWIEEPTMATDHRHFSKIDGNQKVTVNAYRFGTRTGSTVFKSILRQMGVNRPTFAKWYYEEK